MVILIGASASGKTEVAHELQSRFHIKKAVTTTSRSPRVGEKDGVDYFFVSVERFKELIAEDRLIEHALYSGNYYGCGKDQVADDRVVVLDPQGLLHFLALNDDGLVSFLLTAEEETRRQRMILRGDKEADIKKRLSNDRREFDPARVHPTDFVIPTDGRRIDDIAQEVHAKYSAELLKRRLECPHESH